MKHLLPIILSIFLLYACGESGRNSQLLERAEAVMNDSCEVALSILQDSIDTTTLATKRSRAIYAVLLSQALDKNYIDLTSDSIIAPAVKYFADGNEPHYAMLTHYYNGRIFENANDNHNAIAQYTKATNYINQTSEHLIHGLIFSHLGNLYSNSCDYPKSIESYLNAYNSYKLTNSYNHKIYALYNLACSYRGSHDYNNANKTISQVITEASDSCDHKMIQIGFEEFIIQQVNTGHYQDALNQYDSLISKYPDYTPHSNIYIYLANAFAFLQNSEMADFHINNAWKFANTTNDSIVFFYKSSKIYEYLKDYSKSLECLNKGTCLENQKLRRELEQPLLTAQRNLFESQAKNANLEVESKKNQIILIITISTAILFIAIFIIYALRMKNKAQKEKINRILNEHYQSQNLISNAENRISELEALLETETDKSQRLINELEIQKESLQLYTQQAKLREEATNAIETSDVATRFRKALDENANPTKEDWEQLDSYINLQFPGFKSVLYKLVKLSEIEYQVSLLIKCKFSPNEIGRLVNLSKSGLGNARKRLFVKAFKTDGTATDWDNFIISL